ncbi:site-specific DNA-methyltransferase [Streptomyces sp. GMY02]|nr:site-specific DNA-methyltransferase [Streptomyces sp. GMY02]
MAAGGYLSGTARDAFRIPPAVARHAISLYTGPGDTVLDPDCGSGTVLVEALRTGRHAVGLTEQQRWWAVARANVSAAKHEGALTDDMVLNSTPEQAPAQLAGMAGRVDMILTTLRPHDHDGSSQHDGRDDTEVGCRSGIHVRALMTQCRPLLRPGGHVVIAVRSRRHHGYLLNLSDEALAVGRAAGLVPTARCVALLAELRGDRLIAHASLAQRRAAARHQRAIGYPVALTVHHEVLVFRAPQAAALRAVLPPPRPPLTERGEAPQPGRSELLREEAA